MRVIVAPMTHQSVMVRGQMVTPQAEEVLLEGLDGAQMLNIWMLVGYGLNKENTHENNN
jgi:hypothetical protein